jgi:8-oxo-dGTP pyrophosphatase MutT (NUDIX family)
LIHSLYRMTVRALLAVFQYGRRRYWAIARPNILGAHAIALTPSGKLVLIWMSYARGWHLPGGGRKPGESAEQNVLRELREEIGMTAHDAPELALELEEFHDSRRDRASIYIVRNVAYRPKRWSLEIEHVIERALDDLPPNLSLRARRWIAEAGLATANPSGISNMAGGTTRESGSGGGT